MTTHQAPSMTVKQIKQQAAKMADDLAVPPFWLTDWLLYVIDKPAIFLITDESYQLTDSEVKQFNTGVVKMQHGIPLAYLTGHQEFWSLDFKVNEHTLIPRPDTEVLVEQVLQWISAQPYDASSKKRLLDLGTGSGCIAISLGYELGQANSQDKWQVIAVDVSVGALTVARANAKSNNLESIEFVQSNWYSELSTNDEHRFDVIVSNPPYIDETDKHLAGLRAEPISALSAPNHGLADIEHIVQHTPQYLRLGGLLAIEHGFDQGAGVRQLFADHNFEAIQTIQDFGGNDRVTLGQLL